MAAFATHSFVSKLSKLSDSQQSIQTLSHWVQFHKKACNESAAVWAQEAGRATPARQLIFLYLANDIMQHSKRKGEEFVKAYGAQLVTVLPKIFAAATSAVQGKILRMLSIWEERRILESDVSSVLRARIGGDSSGGGSGIEGGPSPGATASTASVALPTKPVPSPPARRQSSGSSGSPKLASVMELEVRRRHAQSALPLRLNLTVLSHHHPIQRHVAAVHSPALMPPASLLLCLFNETISGHIWREIVAIDETIDTPLSSAQVDLSAPTPSAAEGSAVAATAYSPGSAFGGEAVPSVPLSMLLETLDQGSLVDELQVRSVHVHREVFMCTEQRARAPSSVHVHRAAFSARGTYDLCLSGRARGRTDLA